MTESFYAEIGGHDTIATIVRVFYEGVADDPLLRPRLDRLLGLGAP